MPMQAPARTDSVVTLLVVDDTPENLAVMTELLSPSYRVLVANSGPRAIRLAQAEPRPDLILLDVMMPDMDGYTVLERLRQDPRTADLPVIFVTAMNATEDEQRGFDLGAVDYITKPIRPPIVLARVRAHLDLKEARDWLKNKNEVLEAEVAARLKEILLIQDVSIHALARLAETRDPETGNHIRRTQSYVRALAEQLADHPRFSNQLTPDYIDLLAKSAPLHDIGKVGIPDHILLKPGKLSAEEWEIMQSHARLGSDAIEQAERDAVKPVAFLAIAKQIAHWHHEKWNGSGYPDALAGDNIPVPARLMALADVFDALISRRVYKPPMPYEQAREIIVGERGRHFDPDVVDAFMAVYDQFVTIAERYGDEGHAD